MKKVISEPRERDTVLLRDINQGRTYIAIFPTGGKYKLHRVGNNKWVFAQLQNSYCWATGILGSMEKAIYGAIGQGADVYEISSTKDFIRCLEM